jgi:hypothetical protein
MSGSRGRPRSRRAATGAAHGLLQGIGEPPLDLVDDLLHDRRAGRGVRCGMIEASDTMVATRWMSASTVASSSGSSSIWRRPETLHRVLCITRTTLVGK